MAPQIIKIAGNSNFLSHKQQLLDYFLHLEMNHKPSFVFAPHPSATEGPAAEGKCGGSVLCQVCRGLSPRSAETIIAGSLLGVDRWDEGKQMLRFKRF